MHHRPLADAKGALLGRAQPMVRNGREHVDGVEEVVGHLELPQVNVQVLEEEGQLLAHVLLGPVPGALLHQAVEDVAQVALPNTL